MDSNSVFFETVGTICTKYTWTINKQGENNLFKWFWSVDPDSWLVYLFKTKNRRTETEFLLPINVKESNYLVSVFFYLYNSWSSGERFGTIWWSGNI